MIKRICAISFSIFLIFHSIPAHAAIKAGTVCKTLGTTSVFSGKTFTCIKSGKKLVWDKGQKFTSTNSKSFTPWASDFDTKLLVQTALNSTNDYFGNVVPSNNYELTIDAAITSSDKEWITKTLNYANGSFSKLSRDKVKVFLGTTHDWARTNLRAQNLWVGDPKSPFACSDGTRDAYCADRNLVLLVYSDLYKAELGYGWDVGRRSTPAHEIFHTIQFSLASKSSQDLLSGINEIIPRWLMEGSANFYGYYINEKVGLNTYQEGRASQIESNKSYSTSIPLSNYSKFNSLDPYGIGQAASEYLIASIGFENFLNIFKFTGTDGNFESGFKRATGIEIAEFYSKFESARKSMKIGI